MLSIVYSTYSTCAYPVTIANRKKRKKEKKRKENAQEWMFCTPLEERKGIQNKEKDEKCL